MSKKFTRSQCRPRYERLCHKNMKVTPGNDASATSRKYVNRKIATEADKNDLNGYLKLDGTKQMRANLKNE